MTIKELEAKGFRFYIDFRGYRVEYRWKWQNLIQVRTIAAVNYWLPDSKAVMLERAA